MDAVISRQQLISKPVRVRATGDGNGSGYGGNGRRGWSSGHGGRSYEGGMFSGLRGNIFLLGEIGDAARTVTDILSVGRSRLSKPLPRWSVCASCCAV